MCLKNFGNFWGLKPATLFKERLWHRYFSLNFVKFLRISFKQNTSERLLLYYFSTATNKSESINDSPVFLKENSQIQKNWNKFLNTWQLFFRSSHPVFCEKVVLRNFLEGLRPTTLWKKRLWDRYFPVNFAKFLRTHFFPQHLRWLLLIFAVEFVEILFCYEPMIVRRNFKHDKNFFVILFKISVIWSNMI